MVEEGRSRAEEIAVVATWEGACFDSQTSLGQWRTRSDAANAKVQTLYHSLSASCSMEGRRAFAGDPDMTRRMLEHESKEGMMAGDSTMARRENGHMEMMSFASFARKGVEAVVDP